MQIRRSIVSKQYAKRSKQKSAPFISFSRSYRMKAKPRLLPLFFPDFARIILTRSIGPYMLNSRRRSSSVASYDSRAMKRVLYGSPTASGSSAGLSVEAREICSDQYHVINCCVSDDTTYTSP